MYEVLLTIDDDEARALSQAEALAEMPLERDRIRATILHVFGDNPEGASATQIGAVRRASERLDEAGIETSILERSGDPKSAIETVAERRDVDLITLSGRKRSPAGKMVFGSVTQSVVLGADRPVLVCGDGG